MKKTTKESRFEEPKAQATPAFRGIDAERAATGMWPLEARCQNCSEVLGEHSVIGAACPERQEAA